MIMRDENRQQQQQHGSKFNEQLKWDKLNTNGIYRQIAGKAYI